MSAVIDASSYSLAKKALNPSDPDRVVCRENERQELDNYLVNCFENKTAMSIYVNGQPGTGKTLLINHVLNDLKQDYKFKLSVHNCMTLKNVQTLYKAVAQELNSSSSLAGGGDTGTLTPRRAAANKENLAKSIETQLKSMKNHFVLVLDEIDQIEKIIKSDTDLYRIFDWPYQPGSKLILIGIANSLDFTDKFLPRLELKPECKPKIIKFLPYAKDDIIKIVKDRLNSVNSADSPPIIDDKALMLCASKIASTTGDIRKVLDICRRAIEVIEQEMKFNATGVTKSVSIAHMMRIFNEVNPMTNASLDRNTMPLMQKILLCTILLCTKESNTREITFSKLFGRFKRVCESYSTMIDSESELINLCTLMQDNGLIEVKKAKEVRNYKFSLRIDEQELRDRLQDEEFMNNLLSKY